MQNLFEIVSSIFTPGSTVFRLALTNAPQSLSVPSTDTVVRVLKDGSIELSNSARMFHELYVDGYVTPHNHVLDYIFCTAEDVDKAMHFLLLAQIKKTELDQARLNYALSESISKKHFCERLLSSNFKLVDRYKTVIFASNYVDMVHYLVKNNIKLAEKGYLVLTYSDQISSLFHEF